MRGFDHLFAIFGIRTTWLVALMMACAMPTTAAALDLSAGACRFADDNIGAEAALRRAANGNCAEGDKGAGRTHWLVQSNVTVGANAGEPLVLHMKQTMFEQLRVHLRYADGTRERLVLNAGNVAEHIEPGRIIHLELPRHSSPIRAVALEANGVIGPASTFLRPSIEPASQTVHSGSAGLLYGIFAGFVLATLGFNLMLLFWLRYSFLLIYCLMTFATMLYGAASTGYIFHLVPGLRLPMSTLVAEFSMGALLWLAVMFTFALLENGKIPVRLGIASAVMGTLVVGAATLALAAGVAAPDLVPALLLALNIMAAVTLFMIIPLGVIAARRGSTIIYLFGIAWALPIAAGFVRILASLGVIATTPMIENSHFYALCVEAVISMFGIAYRIANIRSERDSARARELEFRYLAETDALTGLYNRRAFIQNAIQCGNGEASELILLDVDHFKTVNDGFGHDVGDNVLRAVAQLLERSAPRGAIVGRLGGEEFAIMLPRSDGHATAHQLISAFRGTPMPEGIRLTISAGAIVCNFDDDGGWRRTYRLADAALYRAKAGGRDRLVIEMPSPQHSARAA